MIGKDHFKLVEFISTVSIKTYLFVTTLISIGLSVVKGFRYNVNYDHSELNYPIRFETDFLADSSRQREAYFIANSICDILNYIVFLSVNLAIDVFMLVRLRRTLNEKSNRFEERNTTNKVENKKENKNETQNKKNKEKNDPINKALKMVILNTTLGIVFKIPLSIMSIMNPIAKFYFKNSKFSQSNPQLDWFFGYLYNSGLSNVIPDVADLLYTILISIQFFIYIHFDKQIKTAFDRISNKNGPQKFI